MQNYHKELTQNEIKQFVIERFEDVKKNKKVKELVEELVEDYTRIKNKPSADEPYDDQERDITYYSENLPSSTKLSYINDVTKLQLDNINTILGNFYNIRPTINTGILITNNVYFSRGRSRKSN